MRPMQIVFFRFIIGKVISTVRQEKWYLNKRGNLRIT